MIGSERNDNVHESIERINNARRERSDAAWRPFEEKWAALVAAKSDVLALVRANKFLRGTPAEADAEVELNELIALMAAEAARIAHEKDFETRRGCRVMEMVLGGGDVCVLYNNNFYTQVPTRRDRELEEFRGWLADRDAEELAYAEFPDRGAEEGYTYALLLWCESATVDDLLEQYEAISLKSQAGMSWPAGGGMPPTGE